MIAIIKYNAGNIRSVQNAITRLGYDSIITDNPAEIQQADKVIFPGVGEASSAMAYLRERKLDELLVSLTQPVLGICLGLQLMGMSSEEGNTKCLGIFNTVTKKFPPLEKVPHIGWNNFDKIKGSEIKDSDINSAKILANLKLNDDVYYVHGFYAEVCENTIATCNYIQPFSSIMQKDNFYAMQFHPEKSASIGENLLKNFLEL
ncbi:imidazole glycerol phosphate synthase subunit HisH [Tenacibaculum finnmarkense]|uniref:Imidazole glycerol phosphate synthase subunit HisH n=1 Tax=Tenacibaculum finnmarkense genomovar finnmarkense TaxID=1458503 RepID=A0AAP1RGB6_9FLAO|nr:imidazole glycerol phosphate synthase subunit HisH [Tenacibaculum finnmarkense]MBE7653502.1 imidazole glycerol phosphate synthase subunit HisH [Tenacibaculum finnmarkense genomovar finnmarkense]MBE7695806.1 imidazole glycerol phosphate synthase subunit HisH [Tenacibaculum finnmarkense genomovar finnmarkense]MCD8427936.1 imidazole glycerol phosphate synthase subunit HisH [Tenacibaculum finnmarkense genomovar finnmarkense]MCG8731582.1 imidazole glycerol phosphate synthase subunit HisH [Tenacib